MYIFRLESDFFRNPPSMILYITKFITWGRTFDMYIEVFQVFVEWRLDLNTDLNI